MKKQAFKIIFLVLICILLVFNNYAMTIQFVEENSETSLDSNEKRLLDLPKPNIFPIHYSGCEGDSIMITVLGNYSSYEWSNSETTRSILVTTSGSYTVRVTDIQGDTSDWSDTAHFTFNPLPPKPIITVDGNQLTSSADSGNQWYLDGVSITGAIQQTYSAQKSGNYHVVVTHHFQCSNQSDIVTLTITSIDNIEDLFTTALYPNPTKGNFTVDLGNKYEKINIIVTDIYGRVIQQKVFIQQELLNISVDKAKGIYLVKIESGDKQAVIRLIKE